MAVLELEFTHKGSLDALASDYGVDVLHMTREEVRGLLGDAAIDHIHRSGPEVSAVLADGSVAIVDASWGPAPMGSYGVVVIPDRRVDTPEDLNAEFRRWIKLDRDEQRVRMRLGGGDDETDT